jgi:flagellar hook assembly protein FlgD
MARSGAKRWQVMVKNQYGEVVRTFSGWDAPEPRMTWDGLDDEGRVVADGHYYYEIVVVDQRNRPLRFSGALTEVRTSGPKGRLEIRPQNR